MPATRVQLIGGNFQDNEGNVLALGYLHVRLSGDELVPGVGQIAAGIVTIINLNSSGAVDTTTPQLVWGNDQMVPVNSFYIVTGYKANGQLAWGPNNEQVIGSGGTFDVGTWIPNVVLSWVYPAAYGPTGPTGSGGTGTVGPTGPTGAAGTGATGPTGTVGLSFKTDRLWKALQNNPALASPAAFGCIPANAPAGTSPGGMTVINSIDGNDTNYLAFTTIAANPSQACWGLTDSVNFAVNPNRGQVYTTADMTFALWRVLPIDTTSVRVWCVMGTFYLSNFANLRADAPASVDYFGFRYSTAAGDTTWKCVSARSGAGQTVVDSLVPFTADQTGDVLAIAVTSTLLTFYINGAQVATIATNLPLSTTYLGDVLSIDNAGGSVAKSFALNAMRLTD